MKLIIIEGVDRVGKDTLIGFLEKWHRKHKTVHWSRPVGTTDSEYAEYQKTEFEREMQLYKNLKAENKYEILIWNRSHIGEYVYGTMYRNTEPEKWIPDLEKKYLAHDIDAYLILLTADPEFVIKRDDGQSFSSSLDNKQEEINKFISAVKASKISNKKIIKVHNGDNYISMEKIAGQVDKFIHHDGN